MPQVHVAAHQILLNEATTPLKKCPVSLPMPQCYLFLLPIRCPMATLFPLAHHHIYLWDQCHSLVSNFVKQLLSKILCTLPADASWLMTFIAETRTDGQSGASTPPVMQSQGNDAQPIPTPQYYPSQQYVWVPVPVMTLPVQQQVVPMQNGDIDANTPGSENSR